MTNDLDPNWPDDAWADALDALIDTWRAGRIPGCLFHSTGLSKARKIAKTGLVGSEGIIPGPGGNEDEPEIRDVIHLGTPEVATWYARDTALEREAQVAMVVVDVAAWLATQGGRPEDHLLIDLNALDWPVYEALGAPDDQTVQAAWQRGGDWRDGLAVTGTVALVTDNRSAKLPGSALLVLTSPEQLAAFAAAPPPGFGEARQIGAAIVEAAGRPMPWRSPDWRFRTANLRTDATLHITAGPL